MTAGTAPTPNPASDPRLQRIVEAHRYPLLFASISGAHLYGFPSPDSDVDLRGAHILPLQDIVALEVSDKTLENSSVIEGLEMDIVTHDIHKFFGMLLQKNGYVLEQLMSPLIVRTSAEHEELQQLAPRLVTKNHAHHYKGFAHTQWKLLLKEPVPRVKPLLYVYRVLLTGIYLMRTGLLETNLLKLNEVYRLPYIPGLIECKTSGREKEPLVESISFHQSEFERLMGELEASSECSFLPEAPAPDVRVAVNDILIRIRLNGLTPRLQTMPDATP
ncbi:nucleotidyltransferase [Verrucomicrobia bacterium LW23]|nr:nucleotidyltransferase [Verrucomicrobia bacterium LW23]